MGQHINLWRYILEMEATMIKKLYDILYMVEGKKESIIFYKAIKIFLNILYPVYCSFTTGYKYKQNARGVIVSLTSFPERIDTLWIVIETLLRQTYKPEKIILWLANTQFESIEDVPRKLLKLRDRGLEIKFCEDIRSHKKYYDTMKNYSNYTIVTVDDDTFYPENLVEELILTSQKFPNTVCCNLAHRLIVDSNGEIVPYTTWDSGAQGYDKPSDYLVPIGCEGVLYPPGSLDNNAFDKEQILQLSPLADDLWLKSMSTLNGYKAVKVQSVSITYANLISAKDRTLTSLNVHQKKNDQQLKSIIAAYPMLKQIWK